MCRAIVCIAYSRGHILWFPMFGLAVSSSRPLMFQVRIWRFRRMNSGSTCWWSLPDIFWAADKPHSMPPNSWYHSWWPWWRKTLRSLGLDAPHFRRAAPTAHCRPPHDDEILEGLGRVLPSYSLSTYALFSLLPRWCGNGMRSSKCKGGGASRKWLALFQLFLQTFAIGGEWSLQLTMDIEAQYVPGLGVVGSGPSVALMVAADGVLGLAPLDRRCPMGAKILEATDFAETTDLADFMLCLCRKKVLSCAFVQVVGQVAARIEGRFGQSGYADSASLPRGLHSQSLGRFGKSMQRQLKHSRRARMLQYLLAGREHFDRPLLAMSGACDAGRFGNREVMLVAFATPDNTLMWAPPVVPSPPST